MAKLLLLSVLIMTIALPMRMAGTKTAKLGLRRVVIGMALYICFWIFFLVYIFMRIGGGA
jgi:hypothetical protein